MNSKTNLFLLIFFAAIFTFAGCNGDQEQPAGDGSADTTMNSTESDNSPKKLLVSQPFKNVRQAPEVLTLTNVEKAKSFTLETGTVINIPANAFEYPDGQPVEGTVDLQFTEMHTAAEIIVSGIPMTYIDENGEAQQMQSAGMFEIRGTQNEQPVRIAKDKTIEIGLVSDVEGDYDFWSLDEEAGNWINEGMIAATPGPVQTNTSPAVQNKIRNLQQKTKNKPVKPVFSEANKLVFNDLDLKNCPELKDQKPVVLIYAGTDVSKSPQENKWIRQPGIWHKKAIKPITDEPGKYELTLLGDKMYQIKVEAAPSALEIDKSNAAYQQELAEYQAAVKMLSDTKTLVEKRKTFMRMAAVSGFGRYNCDILWKIQNAVSLDADFEIENTTDLIKSKTLIYMITDNGRTVVKLPKSIWGKFRYNPAAENKILAVMPDNTAALFREEDFEAQKEKMIASDGKDFVFSMDKQPGEIETMEDLNKLLAVDEPEPIQEIKLFPNPASDQFTVSFHSEESLDTPIRILDSKGQQVANRMVRSQPGKNEEQFDISALPAGNYIVQIRTETFASSKQFIKMNN